MENAHPSNKFTWGLGRVFYGLCLLIHLAYLLLLVYIAAETTVFCAQMGMITLPGLILAALMTALTMAGSVLALRCTFTALKYGMRDARTRALYSVQGLSLAMQAVYLLFGAVLLFLPF